MKKAKVFLMLSGGVDSSVAATLLLKQGYDVVGVYFKRYKPDGDDSVCKSDGESAKQICEQLKIPFKVYDLQKEYKEKVFDYLIDSYRKGITPNPDIVCNREIKFGEFARRAFNDGADYIASGHYANLCAYVNFLGFYLPLPVSLARHLPNSRFSLKEARDKNKDQSYFLSQVPDAVLKRTLFPLAKLKKHEVRQIAEHEGLHTASRKESQGICFIGKEINIKEFLKRYIQTKAGDLLDTEGKKIGEHDGVQFYTIGERRGFRLLPEFQSEHTPALFVVSKNIKHNTITVATKETFLKINERNTRLVLRNLNFFKPAEPLKTYSLRIRHRGQKTRCAILVFNKEKAVIELQDSKPYAPAVGQFATLYDDSSCVVASGEIVKIVSQKE